MTIRHRREGFGFCLLAIAILFASRLYFYAPWTISSFDFLLRPIVIGSVPLLLLGILTSRTFNSSWWFDGIAITGCMLGVLLLWLQQEWPNIQATTGREDAYESLFVLEVVMYVWGIPIWLATAIIYLWPHQKIDAFGSKCKAVP